MKSRPSLGHPGGMAPMTATRATSHRRHLRTPLGRGQHGRRGTGAEGEGRHVKNIWGEKPYCRAPTIIGTIICVDTNNNILKVDHVDKQCIIQLNSSVKGSTHANSSIKDSIPNSRVKASVQINSRIKDSIYANCRTEGSIYPNIEIEAASTPTAL